MAPGALSDTRLRTGQFLGSPVRVKLAATSKNCLLNRSLNIPPYRVKKGVGNCYILEDGTEVYDASGGAAVASMGRRNERVEKAMYKISQLGLNYVPSLGFDTEVTSELANRMIATTNGKMSKVVFYCSGMETTRFYATLSLTLYQALRHLRLQSRWPFNTMERRKHPLRNLENSSLRVNDRITGRLWGLST